MKNFDTILKNIGISDKEFLIYETLYKNGPLSVAELSKTLSIPRTTIYQNSDNLIKKGLAAITIRNNKKKLIAELPERFELLVNENRLKIENKVKEIEKISRSLPILSDYFSTIIQDTKNLPQTEFKYYENKNNVSRIYDNLLKSKDIRSYVDASQIEENFPENVDKFNSALRNGTKIYDLISAESSDKEFYKKFISSCDYNYKYFPKGTKLNYIDYLIYQDSIAIIQGGSNPSAIIIKNKLLAENAKTIYDVLWNLLPEPNDK